MQNILKKHREWLASDGKEGERANLQGADLTNVKNITKEQIESAIIDDKTKLPDYLQKHFRKQE